MRNAALAVAVALVVLPNSACAVGEPDFWAEACATEAGPRRYERPLAAGLVLDQEVAAERYLIQTGAAWVEVNHYGDLPTDYWSGGQGRYAIELREPGSAACRDALSASGFDPETKEWLGFPSTPPRLNALRACTSAHRIGGLNMTHYEEGGQRPREEWLAGWSAEYIRSSESEVDPRSPSDMPVYRTRSKIIRRATGEVIVEVVSLSYNPTPNGFPSIRICNGDNGVNGSIGAPLFPERIFATSG